MRIPMRAAWSFVLLLVLCAPALADAAAPTTKPEGWLGVTLGGPGQPVMRGRPAGDGSASETSAGTGQVEASSAPEGVPVAAVVADSPARRAGLRARDRILAVDGTPVSSAAELTALVRAKPPSEWVAFTVRRGMRTLELRAFLEPRPADLRSLKTLEGWIGVEAIDLPQDLRQHFGAPRDAGVMISRVIPASPAEAAGISLGDVVFEVDGEAVGSARAFAGMVMGGGVENRLEIRATRYGAEITFEPTVQVRPEKDAADPKD